MPASDIQPRQSDGGIGHLRIEFERAGEGGFRHIGIAQRPLRDAQIVIIAGGHGVRLHGFLEQFLGFLVSPLGNKNSAPC